MLMFDFALLWKLARTVGCKQQFRASSRVERNYDGPPNTPSQQPPIFTISVSWWSPTSVGNDPTYPGGSSVALLAASRLAGRLFDAIDGWMECLFFSWERLIGRSRGACNCNRSHGKKQELVLPTRSMGRRSGSPASLWRCPNNSKVDEQFKLAELSNDIRINIYFQQRLRMTLKIYSASSATRNIGGELYSKYMNKFHPVEVPSPDGHGLAGGMA
ncbi:hypothetical protein C8J57DRAFT_1565105 [Mycena rebaudengoi]|nr:hypothetical protein C8J57DRAFT_1565105 [Mycena rebaudengoi]